MTNRATGGGQFFNSLGEPVNLVDIAERMDSVNFLLAVEDGQIYQASWRGQIGANSTIYFGQPVTNGGSIRGISFAGVIQGGPVEYRLCVGSTLGTVQETIQGYNADRRKLGSPEFTSDNPVVLVASATAGTVIDRSFGQAPATGASRSAAGLSAAGIGGIYDGASQPCFTLQNTSNAVVEIALTWIWKERIG